MGGWLEVLRQKPPADADDDSQRYPLIVGQLACHPLVKASRHLSRKYREEFPALARVCVDSPAYDSENLWLDSRQVGELLAEFRRLRRICRWEEFLTGLNGRSYYDRWRGDDAPERAEGLTTHLRRSDPGRLASLSLQTSGPVGFQ